MSYYNYNNTSVILGSGNENHHFAVDSVGISLQNNLAPLYLVPDKSSFDYKSTQGLNGSLDLTYYLTGQDFLANFIENERNFISGNFAGLTFSSGYLTSYGFEVQQYGPVSINANINFYGGLQGTFTPTRETSAVTGARPLNYTDASLTGISGAIPQFGGILQNAESVGYGFSSELVPVYVVGQQMPREIRFNQKTTNLNINGYNLDFYTQENFASGLYDSEMTIGFSTPNKNTEFPYYTSDFRGDTDGWTNSNVTLTRRSTAYGYPNVLEVHGNTSDNYHYIYRTVVKPGHSYRVKGKIRINEMHDFDNVMIHDEDGINYAIGKAGAVPGLSLQISTRGEWVEFESDIFTPKTQYLFFYGRKGTSYVWGGTVSDQFVLRDIQIIPVHAQEYKTRGTLTSQSIEVGAGEKLKTSISLIQNKIGNAPSIRSISPKSGPRGTEVTIYGSHFMGATSVSFGDTKIQAVDFVSGYPSHNGAIKVLVPDTAIDSFITVRTPGGNDTYTAAVFEVTDDGF